jgi:hypothetical protein
MLRILKMINPYVKPRLNDIPLWFMQSEMWNAFNAECWANEEIFLRVHFPYAESTQNDKNFKCHGNLFKKIDKLNKGQVWS